MQRSREEQHGTCSKHIGVKGERKEEVKREEKRKEEVKREEKRGERTRKEEKREKELIREGAKKEEEVKKEQAKKEEKREEEHVMEVKRQKERVTEVKRQEERVMEVKKQEEHVEGRLEELEEERWKKAMAWRKQRHELLQEIKMLRTCRQELEEEVEREEALIHLLERKIQQGGVKILKEEPGEEPENPEEEPEEEPGEEPAANSSHWDLRPLLQELQDLDQDGEMKKLQMELQTEVKLWQTSMKHLQTEERTYQLVSSCRLQQRRLLLHRRRRNRLRLHDLRVQHQERQEVSNSRLLELAGLLHGGAGGAGGGGGLQVEESQNQTSEEQHISLRREDEEGRRKRQSLWRRLGAWGRKKRRGRGYCEGDREGAGAGDGSTYRFTA